LDLSTKHKEEKREKPKNHATIIDFETLCEFKLQDNVSIKLHFKKIY